ncbi:LacI family DNA-binding transcriptional regulator, partial [Lachnotalea glycerini]
MKNKKYTIADISEMLGVSKATVSRSITGAPGVSDALRDKVLKLVEEVGYQPNTVARGLSTGKLNIIALILGDMRNPFYADLAFGIQKLLTAHNYMVMIFNSEYDSKRELEFIQLTEQFHFAGLILITAQNKEISDKLKQLNLPKVLVNRIFPDYDGDSVLTDNFQAGYEAALHLIELGHKEIGFIAGHLYSSAATHRFEGYRQALRNYSLPFFEEYVFHSDLKMETGYELSKSFLALKKRPTAMLCINDMTSLGFMDGCKEAGIRFPDDLSLVSF